MKLICQSITERKTGLLFNLLSDLRSKTPFAIFLSTIIYILSFSFCSFYFLDICNFIQNMKILSNCKRYHPIDDLFDHQFWFRTTQKYDFIHIRKCHKNRKKKHNSLNAIARRSITIMATINTYKTNYTRKLSIYQLNQIKRETK